MDNIIWLTEDFSRFNSGEWVWPYKYFAATVIGVHRPGGPLFFAPL